MMKITSVWKLTEEKFQLKVPEELKGKKITPIVMDPVGYFLVKIEGKKMGVAFCHYKQQKGRYASDVVMEEYSENKNELLQWVKDNKLYSRQDHYDYLVKELDKAEYAIKNNTKYVQE